MRCCSGDSTQVRRTPSRSISRPSVFAVTIGSVRTSEDYRSACGRSSFRALLSMRSPTENRFRSARTAATRTGWATSTFSSWRSRHSYTQSSRLIFRPRSVVTLTTFTSGPFFQTSATRYHSRSAAAADSIVATGITKIESKLQPGGDPILEARLGKLYLYSGNAERAKRLLEDAAQQLPNLPLVWFNLVEIYEMQGDTDRAMLCYRRASVIDASLGRAYLRMGEIKLRAGEKGDAIQDLNMAVQKWQRINPITAAHNNRLYGGPRQTIRRSVADDARLVFLALRGIGSMARSIAIAATGT